MKVNRFLILASLMLAGESVFLLPFVVARIFRPTFLKVFDITNLELGTAFSAYGIVAMISYFAGGPLADRYSPRKLLTASLILTAVGGGFMSLIPSIYGLTILYIFWGLSTILFYWAASIKAVRAFGGDDTQGRAFGLVEAGRGLVAAILASFSVLLFESFLPTSMKGVSQIELSSALSKVILFFCVLIVASAILIWISFPKDDNQDDLTVTKNPFVVIKEVIKKRSIWLQALIVLCSYVAYKCTDDFSLYASDVMGLDDVKAAHIGTVSFWVRPFAALAAGMLGDRFQYSKIVSACFVIIILGSLAISSGFLVPGMNVLIVFTIASTSAGIYGLRGLYFALFQESNIPLVYTGSAAGFISLIGFTPDVFMGPLMGYVLDNSPGALGHQHLFGILALFGSIGLTISLIFSKKDHQE